MTTELPSVMIDGEEWAVRLVRFGGSYTGTAPFPEEHLVALLAALPDEQLTRILFAIAKPGSALGHWLDTLAERDSAVSKAEDLTRQLASERSRREGAEAALAQCEADAQARRDEEWRSAYCLGASPIAGPKTPSECIVFRQEELVVDAEHRAHAKRQVEADALERVLVELRAELASYRPVSWRRDVLHDAIARIEKLAGGT